MALWPEALREASPLELVETEIVQRLRTDARMTALVDGRVYTALPPNTPFPLVVVGQATSEPFQRLRHAGIDATVTVRASSQKPGTWEVHQIADHIRMVLEGITVAPLGPFRSASWTYDSGTAVYSDDLAGLVTFHRPLIFRIRVTIA
jgi:hypothetical protein